MLFRNELCELLFSNINWYIDATDTELSFTGYKDSSGSYIEPNIGSCYFYNTKGVTNKTIPVDYIMKSQVESFSKSTHGGAAGMGIESDSSIAIYGNVKIVDNTTNKIFS